MKSLEIVNNFDYIGQVKLSSYDGEVYPKKFKIPKFEKYDGTGCPVIYSGLYVCKIIKYT